MGGGIRKLYISYGLDTNFKKAWAVAISHILLMQFSFHYLVWKILVIANILGGKSTELPFLYTITLVQGSANFFLKG